MAGTLPQGGVSEGAGPGNNYRRVFGRSSRDTEQKPEDASMTEGIGGSRGRSGKAVPAAGENVILGGRHARNPAADGVSEGARPGIYNYRRLFWQVLPGYRAQARGCIHGGFQEGSGRSRRKCNFGGPAWPEHCRRAASPRVPGPEFTIIAGSLAGIGIPRKPLLGHLPAIPGSSRVLPGNVGNCKFQPWHPSGRCPPALVQLCDPRKLQYSLFLHELPHTSCGTPSLARQAAQKRQLAELESQEGKRARTQAGTAFHSHPMPPVPKPSVSCQVSLLQLPVRLPWQVLQREIQDLMEESGLPISLDGTPLCPSCILLHTCTILYCS